jgi:hypothetical protein
MASTAPASRLGRKDSFSGNDMGGDPILAGEI